MAAAVEAEGYPVNISSALIGSCTNSSYEDVSRAAFQAAQSHGLDLTEASARNFTMLGRDAAAPSTPSSPAALSGWGNPADWRR